MWHCKTVFLCKDAPIKVSILTWNYLIFKCNLNDFSLEELSEENIEDTDVEGDGEDEGDDVDNSQDQGEVDLPHLCSVHLFFWVKSK